jgi:Zc3h12a-like Ribonuclease NYN domain
MAAPLYVVVDGSNIATEGRSTPSLEQLDQAVRAFHEEFPEREAIVVVDASFGHRIDPKEVKAFDEATAHNEIVSPPAGAIGRGDAFVLRVAERVGGQVLSNDSFQEFHGEHPWLFDEGRLIGGKPVPGAGWIFTLRNPVRGPRSRQATTPASGGATAAASDLDRTGTAARAAQAPKAVKVAKAAKAAKSDKATKAPEADKAVKAAKTEKATKVAKAAKAEKAPKAAKAAKTAKADKATKTEKATKADKTPKTDKAAKAAKTEKATKATKASKKATAAPDVGDAKASTKGKAAKATTKAKATAEPVDVATAPRRRRRRGRPVGADVQAAIDVATVEATSPPGAPDGDSSAGRRRRNPGPPAALNDPLTFVTFVTEHPIGASVEGTVSSFVSHGAMVDVGEMHCYAPLTGLGVPPPRKAREVLTQGQSRTFVLVGLDPPRRGAELALPEVVHFVRSR